MPALLSEFVRSPISHSERLKLAREVMPAYLLITDGNKAKSRFLLSEDQQNLIGRDLECNVVLPDPKCSRIHSAIWKQEGTWWLEDRESSNGTFVNRQKIDQAQLADGHEIRMGSTQFLFNCSGDSDSEKPPTSTSHGVTILTDEVVGGEEVGQFFAEEELGADQGEDLLELFRLTYRLLSYDDVNQVIRECLLMLQERTEAAVVSFLWLDDEGVFRPQMVIPEERSSEIQLDQLVNDLVRQRRALRMDVPQRLKTGQFESFADSICVPLVDGKTVKGAAYLFRDEGRFQFSQYQLSRSLANVLLKALIRARKQAVLHEEKQRLQRSIGETNELLGESKPMLGLKTRIAKVARASGCVLIRGESGAGKELVARAIHRSSNRSDRPMLSVNCAAIPVDLMESQLFGHKRGAFTSAASDHDGYFQQADAGTLFLDEVGELTLEGQAKLLRILEGHPFLPVGGTTEVNVDVRVIAATNRDLRDYVNEKKFRDDLYYRLSVFELNVPALRDRGEDMMLLIQHFLDLFRTEHGRPDLTLADESRERLMGYQWPGNVRQMRNVIDSAVVMAEGDTILPEDLALRGVDNDEFETLRIDFWERKLIQQALQRTGDTVPEASKLLGMSRATLYRKIEEYGIRR